MSRNQASNYIWGPQAVKEALIAGQRSVRILYLLPGRRGPVIEDILNLSQKLKITVKTVTRRDMDRMTRQAKHQGVAAGVSPLPEYTLEDLWDKIEASATEPLFVLLDCIEDPRNLGAISRTCLSFGVQGIIIPKNRSASLTAGAFKAAAGALEHLPVVRVSNLARSIEFLQEKGLWIAGAEGKAPQNIWEANLSGPLGLVVGGEGKGLRRLTREKCDQLVSIPIDSKVQSLNASVAAAVCLYEINRQRNSLKNGSSE